MELQNEQPVEVTGRISRKWMLLALAAIVFVSFPSVWFGPRVYSHWQQGRLLRKARQSLSRNEVRDVALLLRRVLSLNPNNVEASRAMADLAEAHLPNEAPILRERVCRLAPASYPDATAWALAALRAGQSEQADEAFELMEKLGGKDAAFYEIGGRVALASGRFSESRALFTRALELAPGNKSVQLQLATIDIRLAEPAGRTLAREKLVLLQEEPALRGAALRALVADGAERGKISEALPMARELAEDRAATFADRLLYLGVLRAKEDPSFRLTSAFDDAGRIPLGLVPETQQPSFAAYLNDLQAQARPDAAKVAALVDFLNRWGLSLLACEWVSTLPREFVNVPPVAPPLADAYRLTLDWRRLEDLVAEGNWEALEFMRFAYWSLVLREKGDRAVAPVQWDTAIKLAQFRSERLLVLARMVSLWGWASEFEEVLWVTTRTSKRPREALEELAAIHLRKRDTQKLFTIWSRILELDPADAVARKNWVRLSLLLNNERYRTGAMAQELYQQHADDPEIATSYALVLHFREQHREGLAVMNKLPPEQLRSPSIAGYYGILLLADKQKEEAAKYLELVQGATLFREERDLIDQARRALGLTALRRLDPAR
jgi:tetratricopeptide (TPR) repeat protein